MGSLLDRLQANEDVWLPSSIQAALFFACGTLRNDSEEE